MINHQASNLADVLGKLETLKKLIKKREKKMSILNVLVGIFGAYTVMDILFMLLK